LLALAILAASSLTADFGASVAALLNQGQSAFETADQSLKSVYSSSLWTPNLVGAPSAVTNEAGSRS
jgi:hypothetical protein